VQTIGVDSTNCLTNCDNGIVLMSHVGGGTVQVWKSVNYGLTWAQAAVLESQTSLYAISYLGAGVCLAGTGPNGKVYRSTDYGSTWGLIGQLGTEQGIISFVGLGSGLVLAGTWHGDTTGCKIYKSIDNGISWSYVCGLGEEYVYTLNTLGGGVVLAGTDRNGKIFRSVDFGAHWDLFRLAKVDIQ
jgi:photosystem II stability/assembly factor-like uncharacterized protein